MQDPENQTNGSADVQDVSSVDAADKPVAKPKATRRPRAAAAPAVESAAEAADAEAPAKPARKTARRRKADAEAVPADEGAAASAVTEAAAEPAAEAPAPKRTRRKPAVREQEVQASEEQLAAPVAREPSQPTEQRALPLESAGTDEVSDADEDDEREQADAGEGGEQEPGVGPRRAAMAAQQAEEMVQGLLTGDFDREQDAVTQEEPEAYKRVLRPEPDAPKLQKVLAQSGVGSRRDIEKMIEDGRIEVNDQVAHIGQRVSFGDRIKLDGKPIRARITPPPARILAYHKPVGEVVTRDDPEGRPTVFRSLPRLQHGKWMSVGRLDLNTEGLLLFTTSGELANQLMHPRFGVEREYAVRVLGSLDDAARQRLMDGVDIDGQKASFKSISNGLGEGVNQWYRVVIMEGRNREVRKLFDAVGLTVSRLMRVRYGAIVLPRGLRRGVWVELGESDVRAIKSLVGLDRQEHGQGQGQGRGAKGKQGKSGRPQDRQGSQQARGPHGGPQGGGQGGRGQGGQGQGQGGKPGRQQFDRERPPPSRDDFDDESLDNIGRIPNPLEQTFDRRFAKGTKRIVAGFGRPDHDGGQQGSGGGGKQKGPRQPDPMQTSVGYIGADAYFGGGGRRGGNGGGGGGRRGGGGSGRR